MLLTRKLSLAYHVIESAVSNFLSTAIAVFLRTLTVNVFFLCRNYYHSLWVKEELNRRRLRFTLDYVRSHGEKVVHCLLHATIVTSLGNGDRAEERIEQPIFVCQPTFNIFSC